MSRFLPDCIVRSMKLDKQLERLDNVLLGQILITWLLVGVLLGQMVKTW